MSNISKLIGSIVGGVVGIIIMFINAKWGFDLSGIGDTVINTLVPLITGAIGVYFAPANTK